MDKITSWHDISITKYKKLIDIVKDDETTEQEKDVAIIALVNNMTEEEVLDTYIADIAKLKQNILFLNEFPKPEDKKYKTFTINGKEYDVVVDMNAFTYAQYVDFQNYWTEDNNIGKVLSTILVPKGGKYGVGYDIVEFIQEIEDSVSIADGKSLCFFLLKSLQTLIKNSLKYLEKIAKGKKALTMSKEKQMEIAMELQKIKEMQSYLGYIS